MSPQQKMTPRRIGIQGSSSKIRKNKGVSSPSTSSSLFNAEEREELKRLSDLLPPSPTTTDATDVVLNAANYIQQLMATVEARVNRGTLPKEALLLLPPVYSTSSSPSSSSSSSPSSTSSSTRTPYTRRPIQKKRRSVEKRR